jgi:hypothetical protein
MARIFVPKNDRVISLGYQSGLTFIEKTSSNDRLTAHSMSPSSGGIDEGQAAK